MTDIYIGGGNGRFGNIILLIGYSLTKYGENIYINCCPSTDIYQYKDFYKIPFKQTNIEKYTYIDYKYIDPKQIDWELYRKYINIDFIPTNDCIINLRFQDYIKNPIINKNYKEFSIDYLKNVIQNYFDIIYGCDNIKLVSDDISYTQSLNLEQYLPNRQLIYYETNPIENYKLLCNAKVIIASCSTFSLSGALLNPFNPTIFCEYPYYKRNGEEWTKNNIQINNFYDYSNIIKIDINR